MKRNKTNQQYKNRKIVFSVTLDPDLVAKGVDTSSDGNFSKFVTDALEFYIKNLEEQNKSCKN
jgi:hypothetical protein